MLKVKVKTTIKDKGLNRIKKEAKKADGAFVTIGVHKDAQYPSGQSVGEVANWNEYGTRIIPARPFLQQTLLVKGDEFRRVQKKLIDQLIKGATSFIGGLDILGTRIRTEIQNMIARSPSWAVPNSEVTNARKGKGRPLFDSGTMFRSIGYQITVEGKQGTIKRAK